MKVSIKDFIEVYNDKQNYPTLDDVAKQLGVSNKTVVNRAAKVRNGAYIKAGYESSSILSRHNHLGDSSHVTVELHLEMDDLIRKMVAEREARSIETVLPEVDEPVEALIERAASHNERLAKYVEAKNIVDVSINVEGPFGVVGLPDNHLNNVGTLLRRAFDDANIIASHPALFAIGIGDWLDNFIVGRLERERRKDVMSHSDSWRLLEHYVEILAPKLVAAISGNHMDWTTSMGGFDVIKTIFKNLGLSAVYDSDEVRVRLNTPSGQSFIHLARHKYPGNSKYNSMHGILVWMLERWQGEDVFWGGHIHTAAHTSIEKQWLGNPRIVHGVQLAAYKNIDNYAKQEGFRRNVPFLVPMIVHDPKNNKSTFFDDMYEGIKYLDLIRTEQKPIENQD